MTTTDHAAAAIVDWGTSSFRLWLLDRAGRVLGERRSGEGMQRARETGFAPVLDAHLSALGAAEDLPVMICGMAGARQGWQEVLYEEAPVRLADLAARAAAVRGQARPVRIMPGVAQRGAHPDVMRGEETQLLGLAAGGAGTGLVCLPGTHSKWVRLDAGRIAEFATFMTGELFALLAERSLLALTLGGSDAQPDPQAFLAGVDAALAVPVLVGNRLFELRSGALLDGLAPEAARSRLSGLLVGFEIAGALHRFGRSPVTLVASGPLGDAYAAALDRAGIAAHRADAEAAARRGLWAAASQIFAPAELAS